MKLSTLLTFALNKNILMSYGTTVRNNSVMKLKKIQLEAGRIVTGATKLVEIDKLYKELGWLKLSLTILLVSVVEFRKCITKFVISITSF